MAILSGFDKQKRYITDTNKDHKLISEWTHSDTVEFTDGQTLTQKMIELYGDTELTVKRNGVSPTANAITIDQIITGNLIAGNSLTSAHVEIEANKISAYNKNPYTEINRNPINLYACYDGGILLVGYRHKRATVFESVPAYVWDDGGERHGDPETFVGKVMISSPYRGEIVASSFTIAKSVPSDAKFTDTDTKVVQTNSTGNSDYRVLLGNTADDTTRTEGARKSSYLKFNPSAKRLTTTNISVSGTVSGSNWYINSAGHIGSDADIWIKKGFVCADGYLSMDSDTGTDGRYAYWGYRADKEHRSNHVAVYANYVATALNNAIKLYNGGGIECKNMELIDGTPFIDFHYNNSTWDYTSRIIADGNARLRFYGRTGASTVTDATLVAGAFTQASSITVKKNIVDITDVEAQKLLRLRPVSFDYKEGATNQRGLIAEEVMEIYPEMVCVPEEGTDGVLSIDYSKFVPYLIKMIQIQQSEIDELKRKVG